MKQVIQTTILSICIVLTFSSCHFNRQYINREEDKKEAEQVTNKLYELVKAKRYDETLVLFSKKFLDVTDKEKLLKILVLTNEKLGELKETRIESWETRRIEGSNPSSNYAFIYKNKYDKFEAKERIDLTKEEDGKIRILEYYITSNGFLSK